MSEYAGLAQLKLVSTNFLVSASDVVDIKKLVTI
jgi:hypothetical protein